MEVVRNKYPGLDATSRKFLLAIPIPSCSVSRVTELGNAIRSSGSVGTLASQTDVTLVDLASGFNIASMLYDGCHPNKNGETFMAQRWYQAVKDECLPLMGIDMSSVGTNGLNGGSDFSPTPPTPEPTSPNSSPNSTTSGAPIDAAVTVMPAPLARRKALESGEFAMDVSGCVVILLAATMLH